MSVSTSSELDCCILTFNCARELVDSDLFASHLHAALAAATDPPDILVLALEELAPIPYSFIGGSYILPYILRFQLAVDALIKLWDGRGAVRYEKVASLNAGMTALLVFAQPDVARDIEKVDTAAVRLGNYELGNKGAVVARLHYRKGGDQIATQLTFVGAHFAPGEERCERRNSDWRTVVENTLLEPIRPHKDRRLSPIADEEAEEGAPLLSDTSQSDHSRGLYSPDSHLFVAGDLNYRTSDRGPPPGDAQQWPQPGDSRAFTDAFGSLLASDQLTRERRAGRTLHHLQEAEISFAPTYKYSSDAQQHAAGSGNADKTSLDPWAAHRVPSWCDRVLFKACDGNIRVESYQSLPLLSSSDHQAVLLRVSVPLRSSSQDTGGTHQMPPPPFEISQHAGTRAVRSRSKEYAVGVAALVALTWEGRLMFLGALAGAVGGWAILQSLI
ncbi:hypothetical protein ANO11243_028870 [Dothideomycetidae sp. 11243]|nr:hypothetical protein ANO11243_028870 [fungal sp. No.11243]